MIYLDKTSVVATLQNYEMKYYLTNHDDFRHNRLATIDPLCNEAPFAVQHLSHHTHDNDQSMFWNKKLHRSV